MVDVDGKASYVPGEVYFRVTYPDREMLYICIESFVFLDKHRADAESEEVWYFQSASDYGRFGSAFRPRARDRPVVCATADEALHMLDAVRLATVIAEAATRRLIKRGGM